MLRNSTTASSVANGSPLYAAIDGRSIGSGLGGDETMLRGVLRGLAFSATENDRFVVLGGAAAGLPPEILTSSQFEHRDIPRHSGGKHFALELPKALRAMTPRPTAVLSVTHAPATSASPRVLVVNDLSFLTAPHFYPRSTRARLRSAIGWQIRRCAAVVTVSEHSRQEILNHYEIAETHVVTVPNSIDPPRVLDEGERAQAAALLRERGVNRPFVLYLGNLHPRKNVPRLIRAFVKAHNAGPLADHQLVLAGSAWWDSAEEERAMQSAPAGSIVRLGRVDDLLREYLLQNAEALAYLAQFEGFGLPPLEAMARGTAVIATTSGAIPEVVGDAALLVDAGDDAAVEDGLIRITTDDSLRHSLVARGHERAADFGPHRTGPAARAALELASSAHH